jgi:hypothetical protein
MIVKNGIIIYRDAPEYCALRTNHYPGALRGITL